MVMLWQATWWYVVPLDAFEVVRASSLKVIRALQTLSRFAVQVGCDISRHRSSALCSLPAFSCCHVVHDCMTSACQQ